MTAVAAGLCASGAAVAADRDESAAREYVYCGRIVAALESAYELAGRADGVRAFRAMRGFFVMAATVRSDGEFMKLEIERSSQRFKERFSGRDVPAENKELTSEGERCLELFDTEVKPLLGLKKM
ncbi:MAG: hypothetical protein EOP39_12150 [Rubrivivax sp.]|nr:MAG: hypothetical protein EOP39_12150 [Rubrivivax sp.]